MMVQVSKQGVLRCVKCRAEFRCGPEPGAEKCWCADLPLVMPVTDEGCLCPPCLKEAVRARLSAKSPP